MNLKRFSMVLEAQAHWILFRSCERRCPHLSQHIVGGPDVERGKERGTSRDSGSFQVQRVVVELNIVSPLA